MSTSSQIKENVAGIVNEGTSSPIGVILGPFRRFMKMEAASGFVLIGCMIVALIWANSGLAESYHAIWETHLRIGIGGWAIDHSLHEWVNDGLMAIFFFYVGLEIKREVLVGELSSMRNAAVPILAAVGGMALPAIVYLLLNGGSGAASGWAVPTATDIAFSLGVLATLGKRIPIGIVVFLTALAIVDDLGAVLIIGLFYNSSISIGWLIAAFVILGLLALANRLGVRSVAVFAGLGVAIWIAMLHSGIHATVAGVLTAMTIPARTAINSIDFLSRGRRLLDAFEKLGVSERDVLGVDGQEAIAGGLGRMCEMAQAPSERLLHSLAPWVAFGIMPVFALANAGIVIEGDIGAALVSPVTLGVALGLFVGKQIGVTLF